MANRKVALNQINVSDRIRVLKDTDGTPKLDLLDSPVADITIWYQRGPDTSVVSETSGVNILGSVTAAHNDWGIINTIDGWYRVDLPDAAFADGESDVVWGLYATGFTGVSRTIEINPFIKFQGTASAATPTITTLDSSVPVPMYKGDYIYVVEGTGIGQTRMIQSVSGLQATHQAWSINISTTTSTIVIIPGDATIATGAINCDDAITTRSTPAEVATEIDTALTDLNLDHLMANAGDGTTVVDGSIIAQIVSAASGTADWDSYDRLTDSLEAVSGTINSTDTAVAALNDIAAADVWSELLGTTSESASAILQVIASAVSGKISGAATSTITIRNIQDTADVISATVDGDGNRSAVTITYPAD